MSVLVARDLVKRFGDRVAVGGVSFEVDVGETYGLLGPNGAGKTTTISMIAGLLDRDGGEVVVAGDPIDPGAVAAKRHVGLVPQEIAIYPDLTARENLEFFAVLYGMGSDRETRIDEVLEIVGLTERAGDLTKEYSGGMKRRLNIAIGLLHRPELLILDEPTVGVDPQSRNAILDAVEELGSGGMAVVYTTHYMEEAERLCDRVGIIDEGKIVAEGTRRELIALVGERDLIRLAFSGDPATVVRVGRGIAGVDRITADAGVAEVVTGDASTVLPGLVAALTDAEITVRRIEVEQPDLEAVFLHLTGKALRD